MGNHLVILKKEYANLILSGAKTVESRFTKTRQPYFNNVRAGDKLFIKISSGPVCATAIVEKAKHLENLTPEKILELKETLNDQIMGADEYWQSKNDCKYGVLARLKDVKAIEAVWITKRDWRAWVVLTERENFGLK